ncbi:MAG: O-antigen ligase family protein [Patescibacteria group bacterium]
MYPQSPSPIRNRILAWLGLGLLFFMPYATFILQAVRHGADFLNVSFNGALDLVTKSWKELILGILVLCVLGYILRHRNLPFRMHAMDWLIVLFMAYGVLVGGTIIHSSEDVIFGFRYDFAVFAFYFVARSFWSDAVALLRLLRTLNLAALPLLLFGVLQVFLLPRTFLEHFGYSNVVQVGGNPLPPFHLIGDNLVRAMSTFPGPNSLAMYAAFLLLASLFFGRRWFPRRWWIADLALISIVLLTTYSRAHLLSVLAGAAVYVLLRSHALQRNVQRLRAIILTFVFCVIVAGLLLSIVPVANTGSGSTLQALLFHNSSSVLHRNARLDGWERIRAHPWGTGLGSVGLATLNTGRYVRNPESWYVQVTQEFGWPGLALALVAIGSILSWLVSQYMTQRDDVRRLSAFFLVSFTAVVVSAQFLPSWFEVGSITWWVLFGLYVSAVDRESISSSARILRDQSTA